MTKATKSPARPCQAAPENGSRPRSHLPPDVYVTCSQRVNIDLCSYINLTNHLTRTLRDDIPMTGVFILSTKVTFSFTITST